MQIKLTEAVDLMIRCIKSCTSIDQLSLTMDWMVELIMPSNFVEDDVGNILIAREMLLKLTEEKNNEIKGIGDIEELDLKTQTIHD